jgi:hypothetical protein
VDDSRPCVAAREAAKRESGASNRTSDNGSVGDQTALRQRPAKRAAANIVAARGRRPASDRVQLTDRENAAAAGAALHAAVPKLPADAIDARRRHAGEAGHTARGGFG